MKHPPCFYEVMLDIIRRPTMFLGGRVNVSQDDFLDNDFITYIHLVCTWQSLGTDSSNQAVRFQYLPQRMMLRGFHGDQHNKTIPKVDQLGAVTSVSVLGRTLAVIETWGIGTM